ncbi:MAG: beta-phosphoglucomutase [Velocimicrobium sp.]
MIKYKALIFDLDGVICHTDYYHFQAWKMIADKLGISFDETINNRLRGVSRMESLEILLETYNGTISEEDKCKLTEEKNKRYQQLLKQLSPEKLNKEVKRTLDVLKRSGVKLAIGSSSKNAKFILSQIGLESYFDTITDGCDIIYSKPNPEVFIKAAQGLKEEPVNCLVIEDSIAGIQAAKAGGMESAAIGDAVSSPIANYHLHEFSELLHIVESVS